MLQPHEPRWTHLGLTAHHRVETREVIVRNTSSSSQAPHRTLRRGRITAALAAGVITVVVGSVGTASADAPEGAKFTIVESPEGTNYRVSETPEGAKFNVADEPELSAGGGGHANFR